MTPMDPTSHFAQLLAAATAQDEPQRLLFVFATAELPDDATPAQRERFERGEGGALAPLMCVDKAADELAGFDALVAESRRAGPPWQVVFVAALGGQGGRPPAEAQVERALEAMVEGVRSGSIGRFAAYDVHGAPLHFSQ